MLNSIEYFRKLHNPSAMRNRDPILEILKTQIEPNKVLLEISSGVGVHATYFAQHFPNVVFQPTEFDRGLFNSIMAYIEECPTNNVCRPVYVDISEPYTSWGELPFPRETEIRKFKDCGNYFDYMLNINMMHISPFKCSEGLFSNAGHLLKPGGKLFTYGPYSMNGILTPESNIRFNESLKSQNPEWGVRDLKDLREIAQKSSIELVKTFDLPANNKFIIWQKD